MEAVSGAPTVQWSLLSLPTEVIETILLSPALRVPDLCRVRQVCQCLHRVVHRLWTRAAAVKWKYWGSLSGSSHDEWYRLCCQRCLCELHLRRAIDQLTRLGVKVSLTDEDDLSVFPNLLEREALSVQVFYCVLDEILQQPMKSANLTDQFYALYAKEHLIRQHLAREGEELLKSPAGEQTMERGAVLIAQWMRPCHCADTASIEAQLDVIAEMVAKELLKREKEEGGSEQEVLTLSPKRPRETATAEVVGLGMSADSVLAAINSVLYEQLGFRGAPRDHFYEVENSYIDMVLEKKVGIPITLSAVYEAVARRLGIRLLPVSFPGHFLLKLPHEEEGTVPPPSKPIFIDAFSHGRRLTSDQCSGLVPFAAHLSPSELFSAAPPFKVYLRMIANIYNVVVSHNIERTFDTDSGQWLPIPLTSLLTLRLTLCPLIENAFALSTAADVAAIFCELRYSPKMVMKVLSELSTDRSMQMQQITLHGLLLRTRAVEEWKRKMMLTDITQKKRTDRIKFRIGMIMKHKRYHYHCVIYGWDDRCRQSEAWIAQMGVDQLPSGRQQPFYNVLVEDGTHRYASQENLFDCPAQEMGAIPHWEVGKYFYHFTGKSYLPNHALKQQYHEDL